MMEFREVYGQYSVEITIELISDTFVVTSSSNKKDSEIYMHTSVVKKLIGECLKHNMLIRGATSYGEYFTEDKVFVGSAVDDAASWHEQGDEIGIFFTPKGYISTQKDIARKCLAEKLLCRKTPHLKSKSQAYKTYFVNWGEYYDEYKRVIDSDSYKTILPEIVNKIMNSDNRGKELVKFIKE